MRPLQNGDLCNVDVTVYHRGFHGDLNETLFIGEVDEKSKQLTRVTYEALMKAIEIGNYYIYFYITCSLNVPVIRFSKLNLV